jgi:parvulin-like peptidyl-prolyl isomerase
MGKRIFKSLALILGIVIMFSGCALVEVDPERDMAQVVAVINGEKVTKGEAMELYASISYNVAYQEYLYHSYGITGVSFGDPKELTVDQLVNDRVLAQKVKELGYDALTDEEAALLDSEADADFEENIEDVKAEVTKDGMTEDDIRAKAIEYLKQYGVSRELIYEAKYNELMSTRLREHVIKDISVTDEQIRAKYEEQLASDESAYASNPSSFENAVLNDTTIITWIPEGYRTVKHILLPYSDEQTDALNIMENRIADIDSRISGLETAETEEDETEHSEHDGHDHGDEQVDEAVEPDTIESLTAEKDTLEWEIAVVKDEYLRTFSDTIDEINAKLEAGESFETLIEEYGQDPGMQSEPGKSQGYHVTQEMGIWDAAFNKGAMALENIGDISDPIATSFGIHIIRYESDVVSGPVPYEQVRERLHENLLKEAQDQAFEAAKTEWVEAASIQRYPGNFN